MTRLMEGLMTRLNESAQQNVQGVAGALTAVVNDLSSKVTTLSEDLVRTMGDATAQSQRAAGTVVESAAEWSRETTAKLERLLESVGAKSQDFEKASSTMLAAQGMLKETLQENQRALASLAAAASQVKTYSEALAGAGRSLEALQQTNVQISTRSAEGVAQLRAAAEKHQAFLEQYRSVFQQSEAAFGQLDQRIAGILEVILKRMGEYNASVENNFREIAKVTNSYVPKMADAFQNQIGALGEQVEDLVEVIEGANRRLRVHVKP
jgi:DNA repair exonuclease SbcCD ATPase subunit